jgi:2-polyprenyl-6-methoxyphenol hydroxylase-like FAD-dependent oxidoreductase
MRMSPTFFNSRPPCVAELDRVGILEDVQKIGRMGYWRGYRTVDGKTLAENNYGLNVGHMKYPFPAYCGQHELAAIITRHCKENPKFKLEFLTEMVSLSQHDSGVDVTVKDVKTGDTRIVKSKYVVGADGGRSSVRKSIGVHLEGFTWDETFVATNITSFPFDKYDIRGANFVVHPVHWAVIAQTGGDNSPWRIAFGIEKGLTPEEVRKRAPEHLKILLPGPDKYNLVQCNQYSVHQRCATTYKVGKVLLAGDAAVNIPHSKLILASQQSDWRLRSYYWHYRRSVSWRCSCRSHARSCR